MTATKDRFFKPGQTSAESKLAQTDAAARDIVDAEAAIREKKTERLRALRLAQPVAEAPKKKGRLKPNPAKT
ncbi:MAG: hypothetical protein E6Q76_08435 [Rhizobium sp.]|nr:MAG: hypothetical protein E6Q76_08435 [Rhizobium sp.]